MDFPSIINRIDLAACSINCIIVMCVVIIVSIGRRQCFNFPTLLTCNTALAILLFSIVNIAMAVYMHFWDQQKQPEIDDLCATRAFLHHSTIAAIHHAFTLQAIERYCKVLQIRLFNSWNRRLGIVLFQWTFDLSFAIPILLTGNMEKTKRDNMCLVSLHRLELVFYMFISSFVLSDVGLIIIYYRLVKHVRNVSANTQIHHRLHNNRDVTMVKRIVLLNAQLAAVGCPVLFIILGSAFREDLFPIKTLRVFATSINLSLSPILLVLFWSTPSLKKVLLELKAYVNVSQRTTVQSVVQTRPRVFFSNKINQVQ